MSAEIPAFDATNVMVADAEYKVVYANRSLEQMLQEAEGDIRKQLPQFSAGKVVGSSIDVFHRNPAHQRAMLAGLRTTHKTALDIGGRKFQLIVNPITDASGERLGTVVEWQDQTQMLAAREREQAQAAETLGFRNTWLGEHHFSSYGYLSRPAQLATYIAAKTTTLRVGTAVIVVPLHNPMLVAEEVAMLDVLGEEDRLLTNHRGHGHVVGRGSDLGRSFSELLGKANGLTGGRGGSVHMCDPERGFLITSAILGSNISLALGAGYAMRRSGRKQVAAVAQAASCLIRTKRRRRSARRRCA